MIKGGMTHSLTLDDSGCIWVFGNNNQGECGLDISVPHCLVPTVKEFKKPIKLIEAGGYHNIVVDEDGDVWGFGLNSNGQLGILSEESKIITNPILLSLNNIVEIACGDYHTVCLESNGNVYSFGSNYMGQLGNDSLINSTKPELVPNCPPNIRKIECGNDYTFFIDKDNISWACGGNRKGQIPLARDDEMIFSIIKTLFPPLQLVACGNAHTLALTVDGELLSVGSNSEGQLGIGSTEHTRIPQKVLLNCAASIIEIACGKEHSIALDSGGVVWVFGTNLKGELGEPCERSTFPRELKKVRNALAIGCGGHHTIVQTTNGIWSFGYNYGGQLGINSAQYTGNIDFGFYSTILTIFNVGKTYARKLSEEFIDIIGTSNKIRKVKSARK